MGRCAEYSASTAPHGAPVWRLIQSRKYGPRHARSCSVVSFRLERLDRYLAHTVARHHLAVVDRQLGLGVVLVRPNEEARADLGVAQIPLSHSRRGHSFLAVDQQDPGGKAALAVWQPWRLRDGRSCPCGDLVYV